ncbi:MAG: hypothetical protein ACI90V_013750, partial [Bacillariaceae sp.]
YTSKYIYIYIYIYIRNNLRIYDLKKNGKKAQQHLFLKLQHTHFLDFELLVGRKEINK